MELAQAMAALEKAGTEQNVKTYRRHGAKGDLFGVSFADLGKLKKQIKTDQALAEQLWETGNVDARTLAAMIADPSKLTKATAERWVRDLDYHAPVDYVAATVAKAPFARELMIKWMKSSSEYVRQAGYSVLSAMLKNGAEEISDADCLGYLKTIEKEIHSSANRARSTMNIAVISTGIYRPSLTRAAVETAKRIGPVDIDHGDTACKTPDAVSYIQKALARTKR